MTEVKPEVKVPQLGLLPSQILYGAEKAEEAVYDFGDDIVMNGNPAIVSKQYVGSPVLLDVQPGHVINLSRSVMQFIRTAKAVAGRSIWSPLDHLPDFETVIFRNKSNDKFVELTNAHIHSKVMLYLKTEKNSKYDHSRGTGICYRSYLSPSDNFRAPPVDTRATSNYSSGLFGIPAEEKFGASIVPLDDPRHYERSEVGEDLISIRKIPLSIFKDTLFELDKDLIFPEGMIIEFRTTPSRNMLFTSDNEDNPNSDPQPYTGDVTFAGFKLNLAYQKNDNIIKAVQDAFNSGSLSVLVPYVTNHDNSMTVESKSSNLMTYNVDFNVAMGKRLRQAMVTVLDSNYVNGSNVIFDNANWNGEKVQRYNILLSKKKKYNDWIDCRFSTDTEILSHDWQRNERFCEKSLYFNEAVYKLNWFHLERWDSEINDSPNKESGLVLGELDTSFGVNLQCNNTTGAQKGITAQIFLTYLRTLVINPKAALNSKKMEFVL